jgi:putative DNA methylase
LIRKKLIEVALPLEAINIASAREKSIRHGHPSTLHLWWARRPLAAARAVIFAQMVDDPSAYVHVLRADPKLHRKAESALKARLKLWQEARALAEKAKGSGVSVPEPGPAPTLDDMLADQERQRLFRIVEDLVLWENTTNERVLQAARDEIWQSWRRACAENADHPRAKDLFDRKKLPAFHDPFAGGGALPLEAQRLGIESYASDLNPVAVLINKAMIEIPPKFAGKPPVNPDSRAEIARSGAWHGKGAAGLAEDVRYYGQWMRDEAEKRIGHLYPKIEVTAEMAKARPDLRPLVGHKLQVIAWLWVRTVKSPNPAFAQVDVPLASTFLLSTKAGKEAYVDPIVEEGGYRFTVKVGKPQNVDVAKNGTKAGGSGKSFQCLISNTPIPFEYLRDEAKAGRMGSRLMAVVAASGSGRVYLTPSAEQETIARQACPSNVPDTELPPKALGFRVQEYGMVRWRDIFTSRQLALMTTFSDLVHEAHELVRRDSLAAGLLNDDKSFERGGEGALAYADASSILLGLVSSKLATFHCTLGRWKAQENKSAPAFGRHALPMVWDYPEMNPFAGAGGDFMGVVEGAALVIANAPAGPRGTSRQGDARNVALRDVVISCDPPYYDNIGYADLSDFFYVWLRRNLLPVSAEWVSTIVTPKDQELISTPYRHGGNREEARQFFEEGLSSCFLAFRQAQHPGYPFTIYYAFKQSENEEDEEQGLVGSFSTGWETMLASLVMAGFSITGTWPLRTEKRGRLIEIGTNALSSSILLVCRPKPAYAPTATRREFVTGLKSELPLALAHLQRGNIAPVDLAQAAIGPGMAVFTRYAKVLDAEGKALTVREALALINQTLDQALAEQEGDFDADSRWALTWFEQSGFAEGEYGVAEQLSKSKNTSVAGMVDASILESKRGKVRLLRPEELPAEWDPSTDPRLTAWEIVHHLIRVLAIGGEGAAAELVAKLGAKAELARELAYRLYTLCERKKRATEALAYNGLVQSWPEITRLAREVGKPKTEQGGLFGQTEE